MRHEGFGICEFHQDDHETGWAALPGWIIFESFFLFQLHLDSGAIGQRFFELCGIFWLSLGDSCGMDIDMVGYWIPVGFAHD